MMNLTEQLIAGAAAAVCGSPSVEYQGVQVDLSPPWHRATMAELVAAAVPGFDFAALREGEGGLARGRALAAEVGVDGADAAASLGELLALCFESKCERHLVQPTFVLEHPTEARRTR
jgi:lysyl-tRNA synthetase class 2